MWAVSLRDCHCSLFTLVFLLTASMPLCSCKLCALLTYQDLWGWFHCTPGGWLPSSSTSECASAAGRCRCGEWWCRWWQCRWTPMTGMCTGTAGPGNTQNTFKQHMHGTCVVFICACWRTSSLGREINHHFVYDIHEKSCLTVKGRPQRKLPSSKSTSVFLLCVILMFLCLKLFEPHMRRQLLTLAFEACVLQSLICSFPPFMFRLKRKKKKVKSKKSPPSIDIPLTNPLNRTFIDWSVLYAQKSLSSLQWPWR